MSTKMIVHGSKALGVRMHNWHSGMDAIYGVGSVWYAGKPADLEQVERAVSLLEGIPRDRMPAKDRKELDSLIRAVRAAAAKAEEDECDSCKHGSGPCERGKDKGRGGSGKPEAVHADARKKLLAKLDKVRSSVPGFDQVVRDVRDATVPIQTIYAKVKGACAGRDQEFTSKVCGPFEEYLVMVGETAAAGAMGGGATGSKAKGGESGKLYGRRGEHSANRYYPVKTHDGSLIVVAAQSAANEDEVISIGMPFAAKGDGLYFDSQQAAKKSMYNRLKAEGDAQPGRAYFTRVTHADPRDLVKPSSGMASSKGRSAPSVPRAELPAPPSSTAPAGRSMSAEEAGSQGYNAGVQEGPRAVVVALQPYGVRLEDSDQPGVRVMVNSALTDAARSRAAQSGLSGASRQRFLDGWKAGALEALRRHGASGALGDGVPMSTKKKAAIGLVVAGVALGTGALIVRSMQKSPAPTAPPAPPGA